MRMISVNKLTSGMSLGKALHASDGRVLLREHVRLTDSYIQRLRDLSYTYVYIEDAETNDIQFVDSIDDEVRVEVVSKIKHVLDKMSDEQGAHALVRSGELGRQFSQLFQTLFESLKASNSLVLNLNTIYSSDSFLYTHCMNVGVYGAILGIAHGMDERRVQHLGIGAMLHDIGKTQIHPEILNKPGKLTDEERVEIEKHSQFGYDILRSQPELSILSAHCAWQHHEKYDGTGYPRQLRGQDIHEFGRLLAVPDVYDALTSNRVYRKAFLPHDALEYLFANVGGHFDPYFVDLFRDHVNIYPAGLPVELSNGLKGVVARSNEMNLQRPVILVTEEQGRVIPSYEIDLMKHINVVITGCDL